jgi:hypothetical protein
MHSQVKKHPDSIALSGDRTIYGNPVSGQSAPRTAGFVILPDSPTIEPGMIRMICDGLLIPHLPLQLIEVLLKYIVY